MTMPAEETVERCWTISICRCGKVTEDDHFCLGGWWQGPRDSEEVEVVPRALLDEALEAMDECVNFLHGSRYVNRGLGDGELEDLRDKARSIRSHLRRTET